MNGKEFWQIMGKICAKTMLITFLLTFFAQPALARDNGQLVFHNAENGKAMFWILNAAGRLKSNQMFGEPEHGWGLISDWGPAAGWMIAAVRERTGAANQLIWHNTLNGRLMYWNLDSIGRLANLDQGDGWDLISSVWALNPAWQVVGLGGDVAGQDGNTYLQLWNKESNVTCYWVLDATGHLRSLTQGPATADENNGWDVNNFHLDGRERQEWILPQGWYPAAIRLKGTGRQSSNQLIWHNTSSGKLIYWALNSDNILTNRIRGYSWDYINVENSKKFDMPDWRTVGLSEAPTSGESYLQFFNPKDRNTLFWILNSKGVLENRTQGEGWDYNYSKKTKWLPDAGWYVAMVREGGDQTEVDPDSPGNQLIWQNSNTGELMYWNLNKNNQLVNKIKNKGWGLIGEYEKDEVWVPNKAWRIRGLQTNR